MPEVIILRGTQIDSDKGPKAVKPSDKPVTVTKRERDILVGSGKAVDYKETKKAADTKADVKQ